MARLLVVVVRLYQQIVSPLLRLFWGNVCRFEPSCSRYAVACLEGHGALRGSLLSFVRLCKCHPFHPGGYDPPPAPRRPLGRSPVRGVTAGSEALPASTRGAA
jgi:putative membrane protein insertion efficiency factor